MYLQTDYKIRPKGRILILNLKISVMSEILGYFFKAYIYFFNYQ